MTAYRTATRLLREIDDLAQFGHGDGDGDGDGGRVDPTVGPPS
jgi:hypothetical protein